MRLQVSYSVILTHTPEVVGIVEGLAGDRVTVRIPSKNNMREKYHRNEIRLLADLLAEARSRGMNV
jgi:hypothetical protein